MSQIKINDSIKVLANNGEVDNSGTVLVVSHLQYSAPNNFQLAFKAFVSENAELNGGTELQKVLTVNNRINLSSSDLLKALIPIIIENLKTDFSLTDVENLNILNTEWHTIDDNGNEIYELRKIRVFLTWKQCALMAQDYNTLVQVMLQNNIPTVSDFQGKYVYFEWIDNPTTGDHTVENILNSLGAIIMNKPETL